MTTTELDDELQARGFTPTRNQYVQPQSKVVILVNDNRIYISMRYPSNGCWNLKETAQFPNTPTIRPGALALVTDLLRQEREVTP